MHHILTITDDEKFGRDCEVEHLPDCPTAHVYDGQVLIWTCPVGQFLDEEGLPDELAMLPEGEYPIEFWIEQYSNYTGVMESNYGIQLVEPIDD